MSWAPLLALAALCAGSKAQLVVTQSPSASVPPGGTGTVSCSISTGAIGDGHYPVWVQHKYGNAPRGLIYTTSTRVEGVPARFSGSRSGNTMSLTIAGALPEDDASYYCVVWSGSAYIFGGGTQLNVLTGETQAPTLSIFPPSLEEVEKNKATVVCLLQDFYPASLDVTWKVDGQILTNGVEKSRATKQSENNLFMASSYLSLPPMDWSAEKTVTCQVTHQGKTFEKSVKKSECV